MTKNFFRDFKRSAQRNVNVAAPFAALFAGPYGGVWHILNQMDRVEDHERAMKRQRDNELKIRQEYYEKLLRKKTEGSGVIRKKKGNIKDSILYITAKLRALVDK